MFGIPNQNPVPRSLRLLARPRWLLTGALLFLFGCGVSFFWPKSSEYDRAGILSYALLEQIEENYILDIDIGRLAVYGLALLAESEGVKTQFQSDALLLSSNDLPPTRYVFPEQKRTRDWSAWLVRGATTVMGLTQSVADSVPNPTSDTQDKNLTTVSNRGPKTVLPRLPEFDQTRSDRLLAGLMVGLDPYSRYLSRDETQLEVDNRDGFGGIGANVADHPEGLLILEVYSGPAEKAGLIAQDIIIEVDETPIKQESFPKKILRVRGKPESTVLITALRDNQRMKSLKVERSRLRSSELHTRVEPGALVISFDSFYNGVTEDLVQAVEDHVEQGGSNDLLMIDLRNNPGGLLDETISMADAFLASGVILNIATDIDNRVFNVQAAGSGDKLEKVFQKIVVIIDERSASASEVLAAALQQNGRAILAGSRSFGKGSVQDVLNLSFGVSAHLTMAIFTGPNGSFIHDYGLTPDICVLVNQTRDLEPISVDPGTPVALDIISAKNDAEYPRARNDFYARAVKPPRSFSPSDHTVTKRILALATAYRRFDGTIPAPDEASNEENEGSAAAIEERGVGGPCPRTSLSPLALSGPIPEDAEDRMEFTKRAEENDPVLKKLLAFLR